MKICNTCGYQCEDNELICSNCGKNCDGSSKETNSDTAKTDDPFSEYRKAIEEQIKQQQKQIFDLQQKMTNGNTDEKNQSKKEIVPDPWDRTALFSEEDVSEYRLFAALTYLLGFIGIIIALLVNKDSEYLKFHIYQGLKITICQAALGLFSLIGAWTFIIPLAAAVCFILIVIIQLVSTFWTLQGKSKEAIIIRSLNILK
ncbi:MAG: hypothetical protein IKL10_04160 [Clostridia bacterium]|nr:hypothetical protein [Clostridia bacterium]